MVHDFPPGILGSKFVQSALDDCLTTKADVVIVKISEVYNMHSLNILNASYDMWKILKIFAPGRPLGRLGLMQFLQMRWPKIEQSCYFAAISLVMFTMKNLWQNHPKCPSLPGFVVNFLQHPIAPCSAIASQHHSHHRCESDSSWAWKRCRGSPSSSAMDLHLPSADMLPSGKPTKNLLKMAIEIVELPMKNGDLPYFYQR